MDAPVVFIIFNRPKLTEKVWRSIESYKPKHLFIIADGPRPHVAGDAEKCAKTRQVVSKPNWDCVVQRDFSETNQNVNVRQITGLNWVFEHVDRAIILEDDCVPDLSWYGFAARMLERYAEDPRVMHISGRGVFKRLPATNESYYFTRSLSCWGWATWARAWKLLDWDLKAWPALRSTDHLTEAFVTDNAAKYYLKVFDELEKTPREARDKDYIWILTCLANAGLGIRPYKNLIEYIGFDEDATDRALMAAMRKHIDIPVQGLNDPIIDPPYVVRNRTADKFTYETWWRDVRGPMERRQKLRNLYARVSRKLFSERWLHRQACGQDSPRPILR